MRRDAARACHAPKATLWLLVVLGIACATWPARPKPIRWVDAPPAGRRSDPVFPSREYCRKPPWVLAVPQWTPISGSTVMQTGHDEFVVWVNGSSVDLDSTVAFLQRNRNGIHALPGVSSSGFGGCPTVNASARAGCIHVSLDFCSMDFEEIVRRLERLVAQDPLALGRGLGYLVRLTGSTGPRCDDASPGCGPAPYDQAPYWPSKRRGLLYEAPSASPIECRGDGECSAVGAFCVPWPRTPQGGTLEYRVNLSHALCGCIENHCAFFVQ
jgi:hypothetical protein